MATDPLKYIIPIGTNGNQANTGDQWKSRLPKVGPNARVDSAPCWRGAASTIEQLKWFREFSKPKRRIQFRSFGSDFESTGQYANFWNLKIFNIVE